MMFGHDSGAIMAMAVALFAFGFAYNKLIAWIERNHYDEGFTSLFVVVGVMVTLGAVALLDVNAAGLVLVAFAASGFWMVVGGWGRYVKARRAAQLAQCAEVLDDTETRVAE